MSELASESSALRAFAAITDPRPQDVALGAMNWPVPAETELVGDHVRLSRFDPGRDGPPLFVALDHERVWQNFGAPRPADDSQLGGMLGYLGGLPDRHVWLVTAQAPVAGQDIGAVLGMSSYYDVVEHDARIEIGATAYDPAVWSSAVNPETKLLLLRHAFGVLNCARVQFRTDVRNVRSQYAIARLGATYEGTLRRHQRRVDGTIRDSVLFSITVEDWPVVERRLLERLGAVSAVAGG
jgi:RimJ/RimL family protein N-acetyltransferase